MRTWPKLRERFVNPERMERRRQRKIRYATLSSTMARGKGGSQAETNQGWTPDQYSGG